MGERQLDAGHIFIAQVGAFFPGWRGFGITEKQLPQSGGIVDLTPQIDLFEVFFEFGELGVIHQTSGDGDLAAGGGFFPLHSIGQFSGGLTSGFGEKGAGVDQVDIGIFRIETDAVTGGEECSGNQF
jgi:hypothetical protein